MTLPTRGKPSPRYGHLGVWDLSKRQATAAVPGERLEVLILDRDGEIVRRFEQINGACLDGGYVDYFGGPNCRPARYLKPLVDIAPDGTQLELHPDFHPHHGKDAFFRVLGSWVRRHGNPDFDLLDGKGPTLPPLGAESITR